MGGLRFLARGPFIYILIKYTTMLSMIKPLPSSTGCSLNIVFFCQDFLKFATSPSPALGCYWLYKKLPANRSDCALALR